jgi:conjugative transfer region protein (TIGR03748 family)
VKTTQLILLASFALSGAYTQAANVTQINRYATVNNKPLASQVNPLLTVQQIHFPQAILTIGDALAYWLRYSGFRLVDESQRAPALKTLMKQALPQVDRNLGPLTIQDGLIVLVGSQAFSLLMNPLNRTVNFKLKPQGYSA